MSPLASATVLPCSRARQSASLSLSRATSSMNFISTRARRCGLVAAHAGWAALAFSTAAATSALEANATLARTSPVMGWNTSPARPLAPLTVLPPMKCPYWIMGLSRDSVFQLLDALACSPQPRQDRAASAQPLTSYAEIPAGLGCALRLGQIGPSKRAMPWAVRLSGLGAADKNMI